MECERPQEWSAGNRGSESEGKPGMPSLLGHCGKGHRARAPLVGPCRPDTSPASSGTSDTSGTLASSHGWYCLLKRRQG